MSVGLGAGATGAELIPGDAAAILARAAHYRDVSSRAAVRAGTARRVVGVDWEGETADAFRRAVTEHARRCTDEESRFRDAAEALEEFAGHLMWAQRRAEDAAHQWADAQTTTSAARIAHAELVRKASRGTLAGTPAVIVPHVADPGLAVRNQAERSLTDARRAVDQAESDLVRSLDVCAATAPESPLFGVSPAGAPTVETASVAIPMPGPTSTLAQIVAWLSSGAFTVGELLAACGPALVFTAISLVVVPGVGAGSTAVGSPLDARERRLREAVARMRALTHYPDGTLRPTAGMTPVGHDGMLAVEGGPLTADDVKEILRDGTHPGDSKPHRQVDTPEDLAETYDKITRGGTPIEVPSGFRGVKVRLPDGTEIGLRDSSGSGGPTIDIRYPGRSSDVKVHLPKGWGK